MGLQSRDSLDVSHVQVNAYLDGRVCSPSRLSPCENPNLSRIATMHAIKPGCGPVKEILAKEIFLMLEGLEMNDRYSFEKKGFDPGLRSSGRRITLITHQPNSLERGGNRPKAPIMLGRTIWLTITRAQVPTRFRGRLSCQNLNLRSASQFHRGKAWPGKLLTASGMLKGKLN